MTIQYELDFTIDYLTDLLFDLRYMAHTFSTASHSEKLSNQLAFDELRMQIGDLKAYAFLSGIINSNYLTAVLDSIIFSINLYWSV